MLKCLPVILLMCIGTLACKTSGIRDLEGTWRITNESLEILAPELRNATAKILLDANGTFAASGMPALFYFPGLRSAQLESGSGTWRLVTVDGQQKVELDFDSIAGWNDGLPFGTQLNISSGSLYYFLADPDEGRRVG